MRGTHQPLAELLRPRTLGEVIGQQHLLAPLHEARAQLAAEQPRHRARAGTDLA